MGIKKNILKIFSANFFNTISAIIVGLIIPSILSLDSYASVKTYSLYISYIGFLHLGFIDGMYIKYGGKDIEDVDKGVLKYEHRVFINIQIFMTLIFLVISIINKDFIIFLMSISIIPINTLSFHKFFYQATGQFEKFTKINYIYSAIYLLINIILIFLIKSNNYILYIMTTIVANIIVFINLEVRFWSEYKNIHIKCTKDIMNNIKVGFYILLANLSVLLFYGIDRWFVKIFYSNENFSYYSFAISMLSIVNLLVGSISIIFYNYLAKGENKEKIKKLKIYFLIIGGITSIAYFGLALIVNIFLKKYIPSLGIISISFAAYPYIIVINALYVNLYKARKDEKKYLKVVLLMLSTSILYNFIAVYISKNVNYIAIATTLSLITWYLYSMKDFDYLKMDLREGIYLSILIISFLFSTHIENFVLGAIIYLIIYSILIFLLYKKYVLELIKIALKKQPQ